MRTSILTIALLAFSFVSFSQTPFYVSSDSLKAWYPFNSNANDESGHGNHGSAFGATLTTDRFGVANKAYVFNGISNYIHGPAIVNFTDTRVTTVSAWINFTGDAGGTPYDSYFHYGAPSPSSHTFAYAYNYFGTSIDIYSNCFGGSVYVDKNLNDSWHHVVVVDSYTITRVYADDSMIYTWTAGDMLNCFTGGSEFFIGANPGDNQYVTGKIDDIGVWSRALNRCEISKLFFATGSTGLIIHNPENATCLPGGTATFSIGDTGGLSGYQWQRDTGTGYINLVDAAPYSGVTTKTLTISPVTLDMDNHRFRCVRGVVELTSSCIDTSSSATLTVTTSSSVLPYQQVMEAIAISPNPAHNSITISAPINIDKATVVNVLGQKVMEQQAGTGGRVQINMQDLPAGIYFVQINDAYTKKVIKE